MNDANLSELAGQAMAHWDCLPVSPRLIAHRENAVFEIRLADGHRAALRLHRLGYNTQAEIRSELWWTRALVQHGFPVPRPRETRDGNLLAVLGQGRVATVISWVMGQPIGAHGSRLAGTLPEQVAQYRDLGALLGELHDISDRLDLPENFQRRHWNRESLLGNAPLWGKFWQSPALEGENLNLIRSARDLAREKLYDYEKSADYGLIHADALRENVMKDGQSLTLLDFDDSGFGFRMYDLASAVSQSIGDQNYEMIRDGLLEGYMQLRSLEQRDIDAFPLFAMLRACASLGWLIGRFANDHPQHQSSAKLASIAASRFIHSTCAPKANF